MFESILTRSTTVSAKYRLDCDSHVHSVSNFEGEILVPLLVSLFTDATKKTTEEMVSASTLRRCLKHHYVS
jgi:hypothetical protein